VVTRNEYDKMYKLISRPSLFIFLPRPAVGSMQHLRWVGLDILICVKWMRDSFSLVVNELVYRFFVYMHTTITTIPRRSIAIGVFVWKTDNLCVWSCTSCIPLLLRDQMYRFAVSLFGGLPLSGEPDLSNVTFIKLRLLNRVSRYVLPVRVSHH
jgi:hypothetical protein